MKILIETSGKVRELEEGFASEYELQVFLRDYAALIPMDEIGSGTLPLLCIGFEVNVSSGSQDLLYVDHSGMLTIIETKLRRNPEVRREVVGQILEYAADAVLWTQSDIEQRASRFFSSPNSPADYRNLIFREALERFLGDSEHPEFEGFSYEAFLDSMRANLERGNIRLFVAVDEIHPALLRTVKFVNRFSERFEIYLFQLKRFQDAATGANIFVPALFGRVTDPVAERKRPHLWDRESFLQQIAEKRPTSSAVFERLISLCEERDAISWGRGAVYGTFGFQIRGRLGKTAPAFSGNGAGNLLLDFKTLSDRVDDDLVARYRNDLGAVTGIPADVVATETWREFDASLLGEHNAWKAFVAAVTALEAATSERYARNP